MSGDTQPHDGDTELDRWTLIRDVAVLQVKLIVDGLRDFILVPISLVAGLIVNPDSVQPLEFSGYR